MDMKPLRYSSLFALTLAGVLLVALKSNALIQYWQQSRHILLDVAPPPSVGDLVTEHLFSADLTAPFTEAEQWLLAFGQAPWPSNLDPDELVASKDDDVAVAPIIDAEPTQVNIAAASTETKQPTVIANGPSKADCRAKLSQALLKRVLKRQVRAKTSMPTKLQMPRQD